MRNLIQDLRYALRILAKNPGFSVTAIFTLALGVGATTAIFSVVYGVLLRPLPYQHPEQIMRLWEQSDSGRRMNFADPNFEDLRAQTQSLAAIAEYNSSMETVVVHNEAASTPIAMVSHDFLAVMGVQPVLGRSFAPEEQRPDAATAALVSYAYWKLTLGSVQDLSSIHLRIGNQPASVIGVLPPGFRFPDNAGIWTARETATRFPSRTAHNWQVIARLRNGSSRDEARAELSGIAQRLKQQYGQDTAMVAVAVEPLREAMTSDVRPALLLLLAASGFLLLIACANVVNLMLAQATNRDKELSLRAALGASRGRLISQFLIESFLLSSLGSALGLLLAYWGTNALLALAPKGLPRLDDVSINFPVLLFSLCTVVIVSFSLGVLTALRSISQETPSALNEGNRGGIGTLRKQRIGRFLAAAQLAAALLLLIGAGLLGRSLLRVLSVNAGFRTEGVVTMELRLPEIPDNSQRIDFLNKLLAQLRQIPGVLQVGGTNELPLNEGGYADGSYAVMNAAQSPPEMQNLIRLSTNGKFVKDPAAMNQLMEFFNNIFRDPSHLGDADYAVASDGFFQTLGIPLLQGRLFDERDTIDAPHVALITQSLAKEKWPSQDPLGRTIEFGNMDGDVRLLTVVGVVGDVRNHNLEAPPRPTIYVSYRQRPQAAGTFHVVMLSSVSPDSLFTTARGILRDLDPNVPPRFRTLSQVYSASLESRRFTLTLVIVFSLTALLLASAGIYGVISYSVAQRTREIGVRIALGASSRQVLAMILKQGALTGAVGILTGILGSLALTRLLQSQLFEVSPTDPATFAAIGSLLLLVSLLACWIPGRRATRVDPLEALRYE